MKTVSLVQGTQAWHQHRATHNNASDAPAMLGVSKYKKRSDLVREKATGVAPEIDAATQHIFDDGHRFEALARPLAEGIVGEELFPCVGVSDDGSLSASFDGLTMLGDVAFEHKTLNDTLRSVMQAGSDGTIPPNLPDQYRAQMEQQLIVSGADRVLFMATKWDNDNLVEERHCWYESDPDMRAKIIAGWEQFEEDCRNYDPDDDTDSAPKSGVTPETLPALHVEATGKVIASNLDAYRDHAMQVLGSINRDLKTDQDFSDAEQTVKWCKQVEGKLSAAKNSVLGQMATVDEVCRTIDDLSAETRRVRLDLDKLVKAEKESRKAAIVNAAAESVREHYMGISASLGEYFTGMPASVRADIGAAIKGLKTLSSITDAADTAAANLKIEASQQADRIRAAVAVLDEFAGHRHLFADRMQLCATKTPEDLRNLAKARVAEAESAEQKRLEAERERIRAEEQAKADRAVREDAERAQEAEARSHQVDVPKMQPVDRVPPATDTEWAEITASTAPATDERLIKLGDINKAIAPLSITAEGLDTLCGIQPTKARNKKGAAKFYRVADVMMALAEMQHLVDRATPDVERYAKEAA